MSLSLLPRRSCCTLSVLVIGTTLSISSWNSPILLLVQASSSASSECTPVEPTTTALLRSATISYLTGNPNNYCLIHTWDVTKVTSFYKLYDSFGLSFNEDISAWDVSQVTDMSFMFYYATSFNQPIGSWNVSSVTNMEYMFYANTAFNQTLADWDVSKVTKMDSMFYSATDFNQPLDQWDVSNVISMPSIFAQGSAFNQPLHNWDVSK